MIDQEVPLTLKMQGLAAADVEGPAVSQKKSGVETSAVSCCGHGLRV